MNNRSESVWLGGIRLFESLPREERVVRRRDEELEALEMEDFEIA